MVLDQIDDVLTISSFTKEDVSYGIKIDVEKNEMISCTCKDHQSSNASCKHMYLVNTLKSFTITSRY